MRWRASARRPSPQDAMRSHLRVWSRTFGACSRPTNRCSEHAGQDGAPPRFSSTAIRIAARAGRPLQTLLTRLGYATDMIEFLLLVDVLALAGISGMLFAMLRQRRAPEPVIDKPETT